MAILELAGRYRMAILEDDHAAELFYEERDWRPLAAEDRRGVVLYLGGFEHLLGPTFSLGYISGPRSVLEVLCQARAVEGAADLSLFSAVLRDLLLDGSLLRHIRKARTAYRSRRDVAWAGLLPMAGGALLCRPPESGLGLWVQGETEALNRLRLGAENLGVALRPPQHWCLSAEGMPGLLFPFGALDEAELKGVLALMNRAYGPMMSRA
jgi:GntR family transcriptional regulator/MocR family aminotransferase